MTQGVFDAIHRTIGAIPAESGGLLGRKDDGACLTHYYFDATARTTGGTYSPDTVAVNRLLKEDWAGVRLAGFVHSHPPGFERPSAGDRIYAERLLQANKHLERLILAIVMTEPDTGRFQLLPYCVRPGEHGSQVESLDLEVVSDEGVSSPSAVAPSQAEALVSTARASTDAWLRVHESYDLPRLAASRVVVAGVGGAAAFAEALARTGVGQFVLVDPDKIEISNIATQTIYSRRDVGRPKVEVLAERIRDLNPSAVVIARQQRLEEIDDAELQALVRHPFDSESPPVVSLLGGFTDCFPAQARVAAASLNLGVPCLCAQLWAQGRGAEVAFTYPGVTPACIRCALEQRWDAFQKAGYRNQVTSDGTTIYSSLRANAIELFVALALRLEGLTLA